MRLLSQANRFSNECRVLLSHRCYGVGFDLAEDDAEVNLGCHGNGGPACLVRYVVCLPRMAVGAGSHSRLLSRSNSFWRTHGSVWQLFISAPS